MQCTLLAYLPLQLEREEYDIAAGEKDSELQNAAAENDSDVKVNVVFFSLLRPGCCGQIEPFLETCF